ELAEIEVDHSQVVQPVESGAPFPGDLLLEKRPGFLPQIQAGSRLSLHPLAAEPDLVEEGSVLLTALLGLEEERQGLGVLALVVEDRGLRRLAVRGAIRGAIARRKGRDGGQNGQGAARSAATEQPRRRHGG